MITHRTVEMLLDNRMEELSWLRVVGKDDLFRKRPDRIYTKGEEVLIFELKPENCSNNEIDRGIGQCMWYLPYRVKPYLVIPQSWAQEYTLVFEQMSFLGVLQFLADRNLSMVQKSSRGMVGLVPLYNLTIHHLTKAFLWGFLKKVCPKDGLYSLDWIEETLYQTYPLVTFYRQTIARLMLAMGYGRERYNPETMEYAPFSRGSRTYFHVLNRWNNFKDNLSS